MNIKEICTNQNIFTYLPFIILIILKIIIIFFQKKIVSQQHVWNMRFSIFFYVKYVWRSKSKIYYFISMYVKNKDFFLGRTLGRDGLCHKPSPTSL